MSQRRRRDKRDKRQETRDERREMRDGRRETTTRHERREMRDERGVSERIQVRAIIFLNRLGQNEKSPYFTGKSSIVYI